MAPLHGSDSPQASREGHRGELPERKRIPVCQASHAHPGLQEGLRSGVELHWAGPPPNTTQEDPSPA